jgi:hypothetical protein
MGLTKLVEAAFIVDLGFAAARQLPYFVKEVRIAQLQLIKDSQSSHWGKALLLRNPKYQY